MLYFIILNFDIVIEILNFNAQKFLTLDYKVIKKLVYIRKVSQTRFGLK